MYILRLGMSQNGVLDFQSTDKVRFVGPSSNLIIDTLNASLGIGVTDDSLIKSNLHISGNAFISDGLKTLGNVSASKFLGDGSLLTGVAFPADVAALSLDSVATVDNATAQTIQLTNATTALEAYGNVELDSSQLVFKSGAAGSAPVEWSFEAQQTGLISGDSFGSGIDFSGDGTRKAIGAGTGGGHPPLYHTNRGYVNIYDSDGSGNWTQVGSSVYGINDNDYFGQQYVDMGPGNVRLSKDGTTFIASSWNWTSSLGAQTGYALVYRLIGGVWTRLVGIEQPAGTGESNGPIQGDLYGVTSGSYFGFSTAISQDGNRVVIGAPRERNPVKPFTSHGAVRVYDWNGSAWAEIYEEHGLLGNGFLGSSVDMSDDGTCMIVGEPSVPSAADNTDGSRADPMQGRAYVYEYYNNAWVAKGNMLVGDRSNEHFGSVVKMSGDGNRIAIVAENRGPAHQQREGGVVIYDYDGSDWVQVGTDILPPSYGQGESNSSGSERVLSMDLSGDGTTVAIGRSKNGSGKVYTYNHDGSDWVLFDEHVSQENFASDMAALTGEQLFGKLVALSDDGGKLLISAKNLNDGSPPVNSQSVTTVFDSGGSAAFYNKVPIELISTTLTVHGDLEATSFLGDGTQLTGVAKSTELSDNSSRITQLETSIVTTDSNAAAIESRLVDNSSRIDALRLNMIDNSSRIVLTNNDLTSNASRVTILEQANVVQSSLIDDLRQDVDNLEVATTAAGGDTAINLADNSARVTVLETDLTDNASRVGVLETDLADNSSRIGDLTSQTTEANTIQANLIDDLRVDVDSNANRVSYITAADDTTVIASNLDVTGNIFFRGERFVVDSETKVISDPVLGIANNNTLTTTDIGLVMQRPQANVALVHHGSADATNPDQFTIGYTQSSIEDSEIATDTSNAITVNILGDLITQNASTATTFLGDGTQLTGVALSADLTDNSSRIDQLIIDVDSLEAATTAAGGDTAGNLADNAARVTVLETDLADNASRLSTLTLADVINVNNTSSNTVQLTNAGTSLVTTGDIVVAAEIGSKTSAVSNASTIGTNKVFNVVAGSGSFYIDSVEKPTLTLSKGQTYIFDMTSATLSGHNLHFSTVATDGVGNHFTTGVSTSGTPGSFGAYVMIVVPDTADATIYYYCSNHNGMGGELSIVNDAHLVVTGRVSVTGDIEAGSFSGDGSQLTGVALPSDVAGVTLADVVNVSNETSNTILLTNTETSLVASSNIVLEANNLVQAILEHTAEFDDDDVTAINNDTNPTAYLSDNDWRVFGGILTGATDQPLSSTQGNPWDGLLGDGRFGSTASLSSDGTRMIVSQPMQFGEGAYGGGGVANTGFVEVYDWDGTTWSQVGERILPQNRGEAFGAGWNFEGLGDNLKISGDGSTIAIGVPSFDNDEGTNYDGYVVVYRLIGGIWTRLAGVTQTPIVQGGSSAITGELYAPLGSNGWWGCAIALSDDGNRIVITQPGYVSGVYARGSFIVYDWNGSNWVQVGTEVQGPRVDDLTGSRWGDGGSIHSNGWFGKSVDMSADGSTIVIGADDNYVHKGAGSYEFVFGIIGNPHTSAISGRDSQGRVIVYEYDGSDWVKKGSQIVGIEDNDRFGSVVRISDDGTRIGAVSPGRGSTARGGVRIFDWNGSDWVSAGTEILFYGNNHGYDYTGTSDGLSNQWEYWSTVRPVLSFDMSGNGQYIVVGSPTDKRELNAADAVADRRAYGGGKAAVFKYDDGTNDWLISGDVMDLQRLSAPLLPQAIGTSGNDVELAIYYRFGKVCALSSDGSKLIVSANNDNGGGGPYATKTFSSQRRHLTAYVAMFDALGVGGSFSRVPFELISETVHVHGNLQAEYLLGDGTLLTLPDFAFETDLSDNSSRIDQLIIDVDALEVATTAAGGDTVINLADNAARVTVLETDLSDLRTDVDSNANRVSHITSSGETTIIASNLDVTGNIFFRGDRFVVDSETKIITDPIVGIANNNVLNTTDIGFVMQRPVANVALVHHGDGSATNAGEFTIGYTQDPLDAAEITVDSGNPITVSILGNLVTQDTVTATRFVGDGSGLSAHAFHVTGSGGQMKDGKPVLYDLNTTVVKTFDHNLDESNPYSGFITSTGFSRGMFFATAQGVYHVSCRIRLADYVSSTQEIKWYIRRTDGSYEVYDHFELFVTPGTGIHASTSSTIVKLNLGDAIFPRGDGVDCDIDTVTFSGQYIGNY
tara:strand:+ start:15715 stop:22326 length:6612 start_codon:yes stop_codon:yes gene_type:complete